MRGACALSVSSPIRFSTLDPRWQAELLAAICREQRTDPENSCGSCTLSPSVTALTAACSKLGKQQQHYSLSDTAATADNNPPLMLDNPNASHPEEEAMEPEPLPLRTKAPPASQEQLQQQPPTSPPKATEDELDAALNGQEPTVKNLILAAIGVMKVNLKLN